MDRKKKPRPWQSIKKLVHYVAKEKDPNDLISRVASDAGMLEAARHVYFESCRSGTCTNELMLGLCRTCGISENYFFARIRTIVYSLNLAKRPENFYEILGLSPDAAPEEIKRSFRHLSMVLHPDKNPGSEEAAKHFRLIHEAYKTLSDEGLRKLYDRSIQAPDWDWKEEEDKTKPPAENLRPSPVFSLLLCLLIGLVMLASFDGSFLYHYYRDEYGGARKKDRNALQSLKEPGPGEQSIEDFLVVSPPEGEKEETGDRPETPAASTLLEIKNEKNLDSAALAAAKKEKNSDKPPDSISSDKRKDSPKLRPHAGRLKKASAGLSKKNQKHRKRAVRKTARRSR